MCNYDLPNMSALILGHVHTYQVNHNVAWPMLALGPMLHVQHVHLLTSVCLFG